jgi:hypothetical protein
LRQKSYTVSFPNSPRLAKDGIVLLDPDSGAVQKIIVLQYNPDMLTRTLQPQGVKERRSIRSVAPNGAAGEDHYTLRYSHLQPVQPIAETKANPFPPPDTVQGSATISPVVITVGNLTISRQIGVAAAVGWDGSGAPRRRGSSGTHGQLLGVVNLQVDSKLDDNFSITGSVGDHGDWTWDPKGPREPIPSPAPSWELFIFSESITLI